FEVVDGDVDGDGADVSLDGIRMFEGELIETPATIRTELEERFLNQVFDMRSGIFRPTLRDAKNGEADGPAKTIHQFEPGIWTIGFHAGANQVQHVGVALPNGMFPSWNLSATLARF